MRLAAIIVAASCAFAQTPPVSCDPAQPCLTFIPQAKAKSAVPWSVTLCVPAPSDYIMPVGRIYSIMVAHGIAPLTYGAAVATLTARTKRSGWYRAAMYAGFVAAGVSVLISSKAIQARPAWQEGLQDGSGFLNVLVPLATQQEPSFANLIAGIARDSDGLHPAVGSCVGTIILGPAGTAFNAEVR